MSSSRFDPTPPDKSSTPAERQTGSVTFPGPSQGGNRQATDGADVPPGVDLLSIVGRAEQISRDYQQRTIQRPLARAYRAWQNQHAENSKYLGTAWRGRSRLFVPKTRAAVRKNLATAAGALFSTEDVVNISAQFEDDDQQRSTAAVLKADMDYRLQRCNAKSGLPWYLIALGGCLDGQLTGVTISKQFWEYEETTDGVEKVLVADIDEDGTEIHEHLKHPETGEPLYHPDGRPQTAPVMVEASIPKIKITKDRPMIELMPIENAGVDPAAPWYNPVQLGAWFIMRFPMRISDVRAMINGNGGGGKNHDQGWLDDITDDMLLKGRIEEDRSGTRRLREGGSDRYEDARVPGILDVVWIQENFIRIEGKDYHFWSIGRFHYLSVVRETRESYPELDGERPYVMGVSMLDTHRVFPQSPVDTWQPLQLELNDIANLRLDSLKRSIAPLAVVKRGKNVDLPAVQRRGQPDALLLVDAMDDVNFVQTPGPTGASYTENSVTNAAFDELAGVFSTSSVQTDRQLNETVGGMRLMSGSANSVSEFDLRMWVETWVEPALRQILHLLRYNESDETVLAVAGSRARVWQRYGYMPSLSDFEQTEVTVRVSVGIGALDPMQRLGKLKMATEMLAPLFPMMQAQGITPNVEEFVEEVMGHAGFKDGRRFFNFGQPQQPQPPPELQEAMANLEFQRERLKTEFQEAMQTINAKLQENRTNNATKLQVEGMRGRRELAKHIIGAATDRQERTDKHRHDFRRQALSQAHDFASAHAGRVHEHANANAGRVYDHAAGMQRSATDRRGRMAEIFAKNGQQAGGGAPGGGGGRGMGGGGNPLGSQPQPVFSDDQMAGQEFGGSNDAMMNEIMTRLDQQAEQQAGIAQALKMIVARMAPPSAGQTGLFGNALTQQ